MRRTKLAEARKALGKSQEEIAEELGVHRTQVSQWERGEATPHPRIRARYADALKVSLTELHAMLSSIPVDDEADTPTPLKIALAVEQAATEIRSHVLSVVNGLMQTPDYSAAIARAVGTTATSEGYIAKNITQRAYRQQRLLNGHVELAALQPEMTLRSRLGDAQTMAAQCRRLVDLAGLPNVTIQVIPFDVGQYEAQRIGTYSLNILPFATTPTVDLHIYGGVRLIDDPDEVAYFQDAFDHASRVALSPRASRRFIEDIANEWETKT